MHKWLSECPKQKPKWNFDCAAFTHPITLIICSRCFHHTPSPSPRTFTAWSQPWVNNADFFYRQMQKNVIDVAVHMVEIRFYKEKKNFFFLPVNFRNKWPTFFVLFCFWQTLRYIIAMMDSANLMMNYLCTSASNG